MAQTTQEMEIRSRHISACAFFNKRIDLFYEVLQGIHENRWHTCCDVKVLMKVCLFTQYLI